MKQAFWRAAWRLSLLFAVVFYGIDALTAWRDTHVDLHFAWELRIPYWPPAYLVYFSVVAVPFLPLLMLQDAAAVQRWERRMAAAVLLAAVVFLLLPSQSAYAPKDAGAWAALAWLADAVAGQHNMLPSLHVGLSLLTLRAVWHAAGSASRLGLALWWLAMTASVLLTHQHHVADVVAGVVLGWALGARLGSDAGRA